MTSGLPADPDQRLRCVECGREQAAGERGWRAYLTVDEDEPAEALVFCPDCATRESDAPESSDTTR